MTKARVQISLQRFLLKIICMAVILAVIGVNVNLSRQVQTNVALPIRIFCLPLVTACLGGLFGASNDNFWLTCAAGFGWGVVVAIPIYVLCVISLYA